MKKSTKNQYDPSTIEPKWQSKWEKDGIYHPNLDSAKRPFYNLMMFPYPSAEGMHAGNFFTFTGVDIYGRFKRMQGYDVFEPIGLDGFGIHSENYALKVGSHPVEQAKKSEENFFRQFRASGNSYDWQRTVETYKPNYYKWTQWLFAELFKEGLAYRKKSPVNFCPSCKTVLADEQVIDGKCERCSSIVEKKNLEQWFFRITKYADRLLKNIEGLNWTEKVKIAQKNWIGKKEGIEITYPIENLDEKITVFTTRPDTNFGATFIALAPENPMVDKLLNHAKPGVKQEIKKYIKLVKNKSDIERESEGREKTGVFTGFYAINQLTGYKMPIWISDFVLMGFGTGAVVGVPGHDKRDFEFADKFGLEIIRVVVGGDGDKSEITKIDQVQEDEGIMVNSEFLNGLDIHEATKKVMDYIEEKGYGTRKTTYHLRDWLISRQRYWGPPIPMIFCQSCQKEGKSWFTTKESKMQQVSSMKYLVSSTKEDIQNTKYKIQNTDMAGWYPVPSEQLPVELPYIKDFKPLGTGVSPLATHPEFYEVKCPACGGKARRETDVSDTFLDSAWYFLRYLATDWEDLPFPSVGLARSKKQEARSKEEIENWKLKIENSAQRATWLPVTMYIGGAEHSVLHLLYSRFITMFLKDKGLISFEEPFARFYAHGLIIKEGAKMSKSKGNIINPDEYIIKYGSDTLRSYLHFLGPFDQTGDFRDSGVEGMNRFVRKVWRLFSEAPTFAKASADKQISNFKFPISNEGQRMMHQTIKNVTGEMENLRFNTALSYLMTYYNFLSKQKEVTRAEVDAYLKLFAPFAPHLTEELFQEMKNKRGEMREVDSSGKPQKDTFESIHTQPWPEFDEKYLVTDTVKIPVQVNGKLRGVIEVSQSEATSKEIIEKKAQEDQKVSIFLKDKKIKKFIFIPGKIANFVVDTSSN